MGEIWRNIFTLVCETAQYATRVSRSSCNANSVHLLISRVVANSR
jgi:hypothetical protein